MGFLPKGHDWMVFLGTRCWWDDDSIIWMMIHEVNLPCYDDGMMMGWYFKPCFFYDTYMYIYIYQRGWYMILMIYDINDIWY